MKRELKPKKVESSELVEQTFEFWFNNKDQHIRSPFPEYIRPDLRRVATKSFHKWINNLSDGAEKEVNDDVIAEKFEEIIFEEGLKLVLTEDEKISINYPFLPRVDDLINLNNDLEKSKVIDRSIVKEEDRVFLAVTLEKAANEERWETRFELPK